MTEKVQKTVGIIGGMGPEATVDLMQRIIRLTPALDDGDHIRCIVDSNPKIPSRIKAIIEGGGEDPGPWMADMAGRLEAHGADFLAIACNTAHHYYDTVSGAVRIPVIHMVRALLEHVQKNFAHADRIGVLASPAIRMTGLYQSAFIPAGIDLVYPETEFQDILFSVIRRVKAKDLGTEVYRDYDRVCRHLEALGISLAAVACTELSVLKADPALVCVDVAEVLAQRIVDVALGKKPF